MRGFTHESQHNESQEWYTPKYIFDALGLEFDLDPCSPGADIVPWIPAKKHLTIADDGLLPNWEGNVWLNPPYGNDTFKWIRKLCTHGKGIALVFSRTDTYWFHSCVCHADMVCFVRSRIQFIRAKQADKYVMGEVIKNSGSGAGSVLVAYGADMAEALLKSNLGLCMRPEFLEC
jgi:hypothetical protein